MVPDNLRVNDYARGSDVIAQHKMYFNRNVPPIGGQIYSKSTICIRLSALLENKLDANIYTHS